MNSQFRRRIWLCWLCAACLAVAACKKDSVTPVETKISILTLNLRGVADVPDGDRNGFWETRYGRIGAELKAVGATPDIIAFQEVTARLWCPDNPNFILDYESLRALLASLQSGLGVRYRIAYLQIFARDRRVGGGPTSLGGTLRECRGSSGLAMLYNPARLTNLYTGVPESVAQGSEVGAFDQDFSDPKLRRSMPCCVGRVRPGQGGVCALIDGPTQRGVCDAPAGLADHVTGDVAVGSFELALRRNTSFHVYNAHLPWRGSPESLDYQHSRQSVRGLLNSREIDVQRWFPPVMVGDFNNEPEFIQQWLTDFDLLGSVPHDHIVYTLIGKPSAYDSSATVSRIETIELPSGSIVDGCKDSDRLWSDHCGALTTIWIREK
jgi:hypothetical protein